MQVGLKYGLPLLSPVDDSGIFTEEAGRFKGLQVCSTAAMPYVHVMSYHVMSCGVCHFPISYYSILSTLACADAQAL